MEKDLLIMAHQRGKIAYALAPTSGHRFIRIPTPFTWVVYLVIPLIGLLIDLLDRGARHKVLSPHTVPQRYLALHTFTRDDGM
jgi:hypothetical protein